MTFGKQLEKMRTTCCFTQSDLADKLLVSVKEIRDWESNKSPIPTWAYIRLLCLRSDGVIL